ncbi:cupin domain-containing protein [Niastella caeni]|uniref:Cupin domain-containing protein n=1 Tax=Niastella caeni TaxID=2569763 RepID=A0A4S8H980_9BACT|nr:cupin domain-containing protein [Niastella caeni]THU31145.1 cupin domain-containing protein [Niastella caeni]
MEIKVTHGFKIEAGQDRFNEKVTFLGGTYECKVSANDSRGGICVYDTFNMDKEGPPFHFHYTQDEWCYILEGEFVFKVGDDIFNAKAGDAVFAPRQIPHTYSRVSETNGRILLVFQPAGTMDEFFQQAGQLPNGTLRDFERLYRIHGMEIVGPPLKFE